jgi:glutamate-1-semialdehyde 2,1-aminomutase
VLEYFSITINHFVEMKQSRKGQDLYTKAKTLIPGGTMLLSKRPEMHLPENWPAYYSKASGCSVWDLDGHKYIDMLMGIGPNALGYGNSHVDKAVLDSIKKGNMSTFSCPEEVELAERLTDMHPWADMARFARSGGEANAIAIRIARAASQKDNVAVCGYHGWHDWYLSVNLAGDGLNEHLLPGLNPSGVPKNLKNSVFPFQYNDFEQLEKLVDDQDIGVIQMEVQRNLPPENNFLEKVRSLATHKNIVLIFDECSSGFRETFGGLHKKYNVNPDMAMFGKTMGNGYAVTAVIGVQEVMEAAQNSFISSTFWTERIGSVAALKTLEIMEKNRTWEILPQYGRIVKSHIKDLANLHNLSVNVSGLDAVPSFSFNTTKHLAYKTFITQEMLKKGFLCSNIFYISTEHTPDILEQCFDALNDIFYQINNFEEGKDVNAYLEGPVCHGGFSRIN